MDHMHVIVWAATDRVEGNYQGVTYVDVIVQSVPEALERVKAMFPDRKHFWVNNVIEHHAHDDRDTRLREE